VHKNQIIVFMGPTGSGKSALALEIAAKMPAVIINADAMQMVRPLRVLTARPSEAEEIQAEHALYGVLNPEEPTSVAVWLAKVEPVIRKAWDEGKQPLLVGGTGMYIKVLMEGLAEVPPVPVALRARLRMLDAQAVRAQLEVRDPAMAALLKTGDSQRNLRALEVIEATGVSLSEWQKKVHTPLFPEVQYQVFATHRPREEIYERIDARFEQMMQHGALDEVKALMEATPDMPPQGISVRDWCLSKPPIYRAHGVPELMAYLRGEMTLVEAIAKGQQNTRNYAKRQMTWLRNQLPQAVAASDVTPIMAACMKAKGW
jgi:tRNA dimethylallyltransferase